MELEVIIAAIKAPRTDPEATSKYIYAFDKNGNGLINFPVCAGLSYDDSISW